MLKTGEERIIAEKVSRSHPPSYAVSFLLAYIVCVPDERIQPPRVAQGDGVGGKGFVKSIPLPPNAPYPFYSCIFSPLPAWFSTTYPFTLQGFLFIWHVSAEADSCFRTEGPIGLPQRGGLVCCDLMLNHRFPSLAAKSPRPSSRDHRYLLFTNAPRLISRPCHSKSSDSRQIRSLGLPT